MSFNEAKSVWMDGELLPRWSVNVADSGVFEGIRCYETAKGPAVFRLDGHIDRLFVSAHRSGIEIPFKRDELCAAVCQTIAANGLTSCHVRVTVSLKGSTAVIASPRRSSINGRASRYRQWLHFVDDCTFQGAYSAVPCI